MGAGIGRARILLKNQEVRIGNLFSGGSCRFPVFVGLFLGLVSSVTRGAKWDRLILLSERTLDFGDK